MRAHPEFIACLDCDRLYERPRLASHEQASCTFCGNVLLRRGLRPAELLPIAVAALVLDGIANLAPLIGIEMNGRHHATTLLGSVMSLSDGHTGLLTIAGILGLIIAPTLQIVLMIWLSWHACRGLAAPGFAGLMAAWEHLRHWSLVQVGVLAVLVAIVKLTSYFHVEIGAAMWALSGLTILLTVIARLDARSLWQTLAVAPL